MKANNDYTLLFSDDDIVVLNKKSGLLVASDKHDADSPRLDTIALPALGTLHAVHRIDRDASGLVIYARNKAAAQFLSRQFDEKGARYTYHALVYGRVMWESENVALKLLADSDRSGKTTANAKYGKPCETTFRALGSCARYSWIEAKSEIDRAHQIRVHLQSLGLSVVCDSLYCGTARAVYLSEVKRGWRGDEERERPLLSRLALHAYSLTIKHPVTAEDMTFVAPYHRDMDAVRKQLAKIFDIDPLKRGASL